mmetsp:Transcript_16500/g.24461  ORF Transcript_16500/g.24461 Transcript_16500/m.24461 type:complete len:180 (-) Transcript_16500:145-684(-)
MFITQCGLTEAHLQYLKELPPVISAEVVKAGAFPAGVDPAEAFSQRIQQIMAILQQQQILQQQYMQQQMLQAHMQQHQARTVPPPPPPPPSAHGGIQAGGSAYIQQLQQVQAMMQQAGTLSDILGVFCRQNGIDNTVEQVLRQAAPELQQKVLEEGPLVGGGNPSTELINRVKRLMGQA